MGETASKSAAVLANWTFGASNMAKSVMEYGIQPEVDLTNPSPHKTSSLALSCVLAYGKQGTRLKDYLLNHTLEYEKGHVNLHAWLFIKNGTSDAILAIRGTATAGNMVSNMLLIHHSVEDEVLCALREFVTFVQAEYAKKSGGGRLNITTTGHSLGGFWASCIANEDKYDCITFCSPRNVCGINFHAVGDFVLNADPLGSYAQKHDRVLPLFTHAIVEIAKYIIDNE